MANYNLQLKCTHRVIGKSQKIHSKSLQKLGEMCSTIVLCLLFGAILSLTIFLFFFYNQLPLYAVSK